MGFGGCGRGFGGAWIIIIIIILLFAFLGFEDDSTCL